MNDHTAARGPSTPLEMRDTLLDAMGKLSDAHDFSAQFLASARRRLRHFIVFAVTTGLGAAEMFAQHAREPSALLLIGASLLVGLIVAMGLGVMKDRLHVPAAREKVLGIPPLLEWIRERVTELERLDDGT